jgi:hypothetical protein
MTSTEKAVIEELTGHDPVKALENPPLAEPEDIEARRIAGELRKLYNVGAIAGSDDPEVAFYASLIRGFGATFLPKGIEEATVAVLPEGRRGAMALEPGDTFDFSNPSDVAEFEKLYRRPCRKGPQACK